MNFTIAVLSGNPSTSSSVRISAPVSQAGTLGPAIHVFDNVAVQSVYSPKVGYEFWQGSVDLGDSATGAVAVEILHYGEVIDTLLI